MDVAQLLEDHFDEPSPEPEEAPEIVAGALQDHDRALIVGRPSFGKSLLMQGFPLTDGSVVMLVVGHVRTPCGRVIQREYRDVTTRDYYRLSRAERDTATPDRHTIGAEGALTIQAISGTVEVLATDTDEAVVTGLTQPTNLEFAPDGHLFVTLSACYVLIQHFEL